MHSKEQQRNRLRDLRKTSGSDLQKIGVKMSDFVGAVLLRGLAPDQCFSYSALPGEIPLTFPSQQRLALPKVKEEGRMDFIQWQEGDTLVRGQFDLLEPKSGEVAMPSPRSLIFVPGLGFSRAGQRMGFGGGYYDRWLGSHNLGLRVGVTEEAFICDALICEPHDQMMDFVLTENHLYVTKRLKKIGAKVPQSRTFAWHDRQMWGEIAEVLSILREFDASKG